MAGQLHTDNLVGMTTVTAGKQYGSKGHLAVMALSEPTHVKVYLLIDLSVSLARPSSLNFLNPINRPLTFSNAPQVHKSRP
jgi:hypothetical protein